MITPSFGLTATERVLPSMALDFTTASLDSRVTFTRTGNTATVTNSSGFVVGINANLPRFDFNPITLACKGLLIEESRVNSLLQSNDINNAAWVKGTFSSITNDATISPDGTQNADKMVALVGVGSHGVFQGFVTTVQAYTWSVYAKSAGYTQLALVVQSPTPLTNIFDLAAGTIVTTAAGCTTTITNAGNGWYRCTATYTAAAGTSYIVFGPAVGGTAGFNGNGVDGIFGWGAQVEAGAFATSYIPTVATSVTRNADVAVMTSTNFSSWYTATTGAAVVWAIPQTATGTRPLIQFDDTTALEIIALRGNVADPEMSIVDGGVAQAQIDVGTIVANTAYKLSGGWNTNNCAAAKDGGTVGTDLAATIPTPTQLRIGSDGTNYASALIQKVLYYPQRIINAEVQAISK